MKKKFFAVAAVSLAMVMGLSGCSGVADLFKGDGSDTSDDVLAGLVSMEDHRKEMVKDIEDLVTLGQYEGLAVTITATKVTEDQIQSEIDTALASSGTVEQIKEGTVADGDTINIDYVGKVDGVAFDGGTASAQNLTIGSNSYIDGFEDALIGATIGTTVDINVTFPEDYGNEELNGKPAVFTVTINYKEGEQIPAELTDEWVASQGLTDVATVEDYKEYVKTTLEEEAAEADEQLIFDAVIDKITETTEIKGLSADLDKEAMMEEEMAYLEEYASYYEITVDELVQQYMGMTLEEYEADMEVQLDEYCNTLMIYRAIINAEDIQVSQEDYETEVLTYSPDYAQYGAESEAAFVEENSADILDTLFYQQVYSVIIDSAEVTKQ